MGLNKTNFFLATWTLLFLAVWVETASKYSDENRPYEFGFSIEGEQHRHEKKDEKGIITGEFGFITGDGVYHVTVYATDENGNFKIISMKSIKVSPALDGSEGPLPAKPALKPAVGGIPSVQPITQPPVTTTVSTTTSKPASTLTVFTTAKPLNVPACSSCAIPSTTKRPPGLKPGELNFQTPGFSKNPQQQNKPNQYTPQQPENKFPVQQNPPSNTFPVQQQNPPRNQFPVQNPPTNQFSVENRLNVPVSELNKELVGPLSPGQLPNQDISQPDHPDQLSPGLSPPILPNYPDFEVSEPQNRPDPPAPKQVDSPNINKVPNLSKPSRKPTFFPGLVHPPPSGQNPPIEGQLPPGVTSDDMLQLLYRFNYTIGFHGHYETGYKNGAKIGGYFVNGRDGISRIVEYTADENGYRPKVTFINLGLDSPDTPKEETEKEFGLKNYVFEWFSL